MSPTLRRHPLDEGLRRLVDLLAVTILVSIVAICFGEVLLRDLADSSLTWYDEFVGYLLVWLTFVGMVMGQQDEHHIAVAIFWSRLGPRATRLRRLVVHALLLAVQAVLLYQGLRLAQRFWGDQAITVPISMGLLYFIIPLSALLVILVQAGQVGRLLRDAS